MSKCGKGWCGTIEVEPEKEVRDHCCAVNIVKYPCCCCWLSFAVALFTSILGMQIMISVNREYSAGPLRGLEGGLTYPISDNIAKQMDALYLVADQSEELFEVYRASGSSGRRRLAELKLHLQPAAEEEPAAGFTLFGHTLDLAALARLPEVAGGDVVKDLQRMSTEKSKDALHHAPERHERHRRALQPGSGGGGSRFQEDNLFSGMFIFNSRSSSSSVFTDAGLTEMCQLHETLTTDTTRSGPYAGYEDFCQKAPSTLNSTTCHTGLTPLVFFYGDSSYTIDSLDLTPTTGPNWAAIAQLFVQDGNMSRAMAAYPADAPAAAALLSTLPTFWSAWFDSPLHRPPYRCSPSMKKNTQNVLELIAAVRETPALNDLFGGTLNFFFDRGFSSTNLRSVYTRSYYHYGAPQKYGTPPYLDAEDRYDQQEDNFVDWFWRTAELHHSYDENDSGLWRHLRPTGFIPPLLEQIILDLLLFDSLRAIAPLVLVFLVVWFQTRSIFIALVTIVECILSCTASVFVLCAVGIQWMAFEMFLAIYIVLAIGADDVFVFMDAYKQSYYLGPRVNASLTKRMSWVYRRAGLAMLITSLTTACAFVATALTSPIPTLQVFGIYAAAVIILDYVLVMTFLCSSVVIYHNYFENKPPPCCVCCTCAAPGSRLDWWLCNSSQHGGCESFCDCCGKPMETTTQKAMAQVDAAQAQVKPLYVRLFEDIFPFNLIIKNPISRGLSIALFVVLFIPFLISTTQIEPQTSAENFLPEDHPFQRFFTAQNAFISSREDETVEMQIVYGFDPSDPLDLTGVNRLMNPSDWGTPKLQPTFVLDPAAQQALLGDCAVLRASPIVQSRYDQATSTSNSMTFCWIEAFEAYRNCKSQPFPVPVDAAGAVLQWVLNGPDQTCPQESFPFGRDSSGEIESMRFDFTNDLGWMPDASGTGLRLTWTRLRADATIKGRAYLPAPTLRTEYNLWQDLIGDVNANAPASLGAAMHISSQGVTGGDNKWLHMILQETYVRMALTGLATGLSISFLVLLVATQNFIVAFLSIFTIVCALCCVLGQIVMRGWQLGSAESLSMMILTGFAVDYVVHLSHAYMESKKASPLGRVHDALRDLGISVFWGMLTSLISAGVLSTLQLQFFAKFGAFFFATIIWAYLWAVLFLMPLLAFVGPRGIGPHANDPVGIEMASTTSGASSPDGRKMEL